MTVLLLKQGVLLNRQLLTGVWALMVVTIIAALALEDRFFAVSGEPVAFLAASSNEVTFRTEDDVKWRLVGEDQGFYDGDRLATGRSGTARVEFGEGRHVDIGQDTIIAISSIREAAGNSFIINLVKGGIKPTVPATAKHSLVVMSGTSTFFVEPGEERGFAKPIGGTLKEFSAKEKFPVQTAKRTPEVQKFVLPSTFVAPSPLDLPEDAPEPDPVPIVATIPVPQPEAELPIVDAPQVPEAVPEVAEEVVEEVKEETAPAIKVGPPEIASDALPTAFITTGPLSGAVGQALRIKIARPRNAPADWVGGVEVSVGTNKHFIAAENSIAMIPIDADMLAQASAGTLDTLPCKVFKLQGASSQGAGESPETQLGKQVREAKICSLSDAKLKYPASIQLAGINNPRKDTALFRLNQTTTTEYLVNVTITREADYKKLIPYLRTASAFRVESDAKLTAQGTFGVESGKVIAQLDGAGMSPEIADKIMQLLNYSFVFKGNKSAIYDASGLDMEGFKEWITKFTTGGKNVYIRAKSALIPVSRDFMEEREEVADFVQKAAGTIFLEKVEIISYK